MQTESVKAQAYRLLDRLPDSATREDLMYRIYVRQAIKDLAFRNLKKILESLQAMGALVIVGGIDLPMGGRGFGEGYRRLCDETGAILVPNIFDGLMGNPQFMSDSIHPNDTGYSKVARKFY
jgi:hypothetical protein